MEILVSGTGYLPMSCWSRRPPKHYCYCCLCPVGLDDKILLVRITFVCRIRQKQAVTELEASIPLASFRGHYAGWWRRINSNNPSLPDWGSGALSAIYQSARQDVPTGAIVA